MIQINNLNFSYSKKRELYKGLNFTSKDGSIIGLLGKNGAGKSTLLKIMAGLLKPLSGDINILNHVPYKRNPNYLQQVFFVNEELNIPSVTIQCYTSSLSPFYPNFDKNKLDQLLNQFELDKKSNLGKLSYGQKKKFIIAFALSTNCKLLIMDEPTNGLDIPSKAQFRKVLAGSLTEEQTVIISTHQVKDVENLIDRIVIVENGQVIFNNNLIEITEQFSFSSSSTIPQDAFYNEVAPGGYKTITPNIGIDTTIDIELLFNAIINGTKLKTYEPAL